MPAATIGYASTACAYQVQTVDENGSIIDDFTAGNHAGDSQAFVHPDDGVGAEEMARFARQTAGETAERLGLPESAIYEDRDLIEDLETIYGNWPK